MILALAALLSLTGCAAGVHELFETRKAYGLERASGAPNGWSAEAVVALSEPLVQSVLAQALEVAIKDLPPFDAKLAVITPQATLSSLTLSDVAGCAQCVGFSGKLTGKTKVEAMGFSKTLPFTASLRGSLQVSTRPAEDAQGRAVFARLTKIDRLEFSLDQTGSLGFSLEDSLESWGTDLARETPELNLGAFGGDDLPLRDLRVRSASGALLVELLTDAAHGGPLYAPPTPPSGGWAVAVSEATLLDHARRAAFEMGEISMEVWAEPTSLDLDGGEFALGLRLWRLKGKGWWRDYIIRGEINLVNQVLKLQPKQVEEGERSQGAALVDPLALLGESLILRAIEDAAAQSMPVGQATSVGGLALRAKVTQAQGVADALLLSGEATAKAAKEPGKSTGGGNTSGGNTSGGASGAGERKKQKRP
ncbi:hypothetical protein L6R49_17825 [Myxococcota bacterium]|nr:hypothetical protein [Myxococcota bacterium]